MKKLLPLLFITLMITSCHNSRNCKSPIEVSGGSADRYQIYDETFGDSLTIDVWLPDGYRWWGSYPVLYMHDGQNIFDANITWNHQSWEMDSTASRLIAADSIEPIIIVGIHCLPTRICDYMPNKTIAACTDSVELDVLSKMCDRPYRGDEYLKALVFHIKPMIDSIYATNPSQEATAVMGSSMGGLISLYAICEYPDVFSKAGCVSTHLGISADRADFANSVINYVEGNLPSPENHKLYFDNGTLPCDDAYIPHIANMLDMLRRNGYDDSNLMFLSVEGASHCERDWAKRVDAPLLFFYND